MGELSLGCSLRLPSNGSAMCLSSLVRFRARACGGMCVCMFCVFVCCCHDGARCFRCSRSGPSVHTAGDSGVSNRQSLSRTGSVAPFLPPRRRLSPDEEKAHFIMLPSGDGTGDWDSELGINKQMTVFSSRKKLLGFYEEVSGGTKERRRCLRSVRG